jgi:hypothetical protein
VDDALGRTVEPCYYFFPDGDVAQDVHLALVFVEGHYCPVFSKFDSRLKERNLNELLFQYVQADLEFVERSFADEEQYSEQDYKLGAAQVEEQAEPQGDAQQVEEGGSGTWLHAGATSTAQK